MTIQELIEELEEIEELDVVSIHKNGILSIYEGEDIEFIDNEMLDLSVKHYGVRSKDVKRRKYRVVDIEC